MKRLNDIVERLFLGVATVLFAAFIAVILFQVLARSALRISVVWSDEVALFCFVWSVFLGAAVALRRRVHYVVEILPERWATANGALRLFASVASVAFVYVLVTGGWTFTGMGWRRLSVATDMPLAWVFAAIPTSGAAMLLFSVEVILGDVQALRRGGGADRPHGAVE